MEIRFRTGLLLVAGLVGMIISITTVSAVSISRSIPASVIVNVISIQEMTDVDGDGFVDHGDLLAVIAFLGDGAAGATEDVNRDGVVDVVDLALVSRYLGQEV